MAKLKDSKKHITEKKKWKGGRPDLNEAEKRTIFYGFRIDEKENIIFQKLFSQSGANTISKFIINCIFERPFHTIVTDKSAMQICEKLGQICMEIRKIGVNYNQVTKAINKNITDKKAIVFLQKLEKATIEIAVLLRKTSEISEKYTQKWLQK